MGTENRGTLNEIWIYPLKSGRGIRKERWELANHGLLLDRCWMLADPTGRAMTQLTNPRLTSIQTRAGATGIEFFADGFDSIQVPVHPPAEQPLSEMWMEGAESVRGSRISTDADKWFSAVLRSPCHLIQTPASPSRWTDQQVNGNPLSYQNAYPIHLVSQSSLEDLNTRLASPVSMNRFRPNLVITGTLPHEDDQWKRIQIGQAILRIGRPCDHRCGVPNIDQKTGARDVEPLRTLNTYRRSRQGIYFGQNVAIEKPAPLHTGAPIKVLEFGPAPEIQSEARSTRTTEQ